MPLLPTAPSLLIVLLGLHEDILRLQVHHLQLSRLVQGPTTRQGPLDAGTVLLQPLPQLIVEAQEFGVFALQGLLQKGRSWRGEGGLDHLRHSDHQTARCVATEMRGWGGLLET